MSHCLNDAPARNKNGDAGLHIPVQYLGGDTEVTLPMEVGDVLLMHRRTPHSSHSDHRDHVRGSFDLRYNPIGQATGRSAFPDIVARSGSNPAMELHDPDAWNRLWLNARARLTDAQNPKFNRWVPNSIACA